MTYPAGSVACPDCGYTGWVPAQDACCPCCGLAWEAITAGAAAYAAALAEQGAKWRKRRGHRSGVRR